MAGWCIPLHVLRNERVVCTTCSVYYVTVWCVLRHGVECVDVAWQTRRQPWHQTLLHIEIGSCTVTHECNALYLISFGRRYWCKYFIPEGHIISIQKICPCLWFFLVKGINFQRAFTVNTFEKLDWGGSDNILHHVMWMYVTKVWIQRRLPQQSIDGHCVNQGWGHL